MWNKNFDKALRGLKKLDEDIEDDQVAKKGLGCVLLVIFPLLFMAILEYDVLGIFNGDYNIILILIIGVALYLLFYKKI